MASIFGGFGVKGEWMAKKFSQLRAAMSTEARAQVSERAKAMLQKIALHELHQARGLSQNKPDDHSTPNALNAASTGSE